MISGRGALVRAARGKKKVEAATRRARARALAEKLIDWFIARRAGALAIELLIAATCSLVGGVNEVKGGRDRGGSCCFLGEDIGGKQPGFCRFFTGFWDLREVLAFSKEARLRINCKN